VPIIAPTLNADDDPLFALKTDIQFILLDFASRNTLTWKTEFHPDDIEFAMRMVLSLYNDTPPRVRAVDTIDQIPLHISAMGCAMYLLFMAGVNKTRNRVSMSTDDDETINLDDQGPQWRQMYSGLRLEWRERVDDYKIPFNLDAAYDGLGSGYAWTDRNRN
jgi:hypothetical protein